MTSLWNRMVTCKYQPQHKQHLRTIECTTLKEDKPCGSLAGAQNISSDCPRNNMQGKEIRPVQTYAPSMVDGHAP
eukprot:scaffold1420_cov375-Pavlova_lutheri.AAC.14